MPVIKLQELENLLCEKLVKYGFSESNAKLCASLMAENNLYGVASHGTNRFPLFIELIKLGFINPNEEPVNTNRFGALEQWDARSGPGPLNALMATNRAIDVAGEFGIGCVALRNTNHWMRAGNYGWKAAQKGFILIAFTNAYPMMPPWGAKEPVVGNNPICLAVPRNDGKHVVLDMATSIFSYGQLANYKRNNRELPFEGGYDESGKLSKNATSIYNTKRVLPIGFWKGSGLSIMFDLIASILSGGKATHQLTEAGYDTGMSQVFIAIDPAKFEGSEYIAEVADEIIATIEAAEPAEESDSILYPGERALETKNEYITNGIPVDDSVWERILEL